MPSKRKRAKKVTRRRWRGSLKRVKHLPRHRLTWLGPSDKDFLKVYAEGGPKLVVVKGLSTSYQGATTRWKRWRKMALRAYDITSFWDYLSKLYPRAKRALIVVEPSYIELPEPEPAPA